MLNFNTLIYILVLSFGSYYISSSNTLFISGLLNQQTKFSILKIILNSHYHANVQLYIVAKKVAGSLVPFTPPPLPTRYVKILSLKFALV